ncbi:phage tail protein [Weissella oryzae SG25]|uniref:Phage tail protein n=1 Tax=Weissella oryzae (strain DSM 25784 / JCM 18191 / LMG 30913 / SG25) TaxID=1329250 RepID=A0A069CW21_WEIOS|nr:hypothetical protein [Weissella oryzae]GAK32000.1 phage tail protein [Weissella oryzae SG25]
MTSPLVELLRSLKKTLESETSIPVFFTWQDEQTFEPFIVLGEGNTDDSLSPKAGKAVTNLALQAHLFYPGESRIKVEDERNRVTGVLYKASNRIVNVASEVMKDDSVGREVYHVVITLSALI